MATFPKWQTERFSVQISKSDIAATKVMMSAIKNGFPKVMTRALNKTTGNVQTHANKEIRKNLNLKAARVKQDFRFQKASWSDLMAFVKATGKPVPLIDFVETRQISGGVSVKVKKNKRRVKLKHAFVARMKSGHVGVFARKEGAKYATGKKARIPQTQYAKMPKKYRLKIVELTGPRIEDEFSHPSVFDPVMKNADHRLRFNLNNEIKFEFSKL